MTVIAVAGLPVSEADRAANLERCMAAVHEAADAGADLVVLPECGLTGYRFDSARQVRAAAIVGTDASLAALGELAVARRITVVVGFLELSGDHVHNSAALLTADGAVAITRKTHLPHLGADRFVTPGARIGPVVTTPAGRVGVAICYDFRFPETSRVLALQGADIVVVPVNWSTDVAVLAEHFVPTRAVENRVFVAVADRVGDGHLGASRVVGPEGRVLAAPADRTTAAVVCAHVDLALARDKTTAFVPGAFEIDVFADRRPPLYGALTTHVPNPSGCQENAPDA